MSIDTHRAQHLGPAASATGEAGVRLDRLPPARRCALLALEAAGQQLR